MLVLSVFILVYLIYHNYVILNEHEVIIIMANLVWISLASSSISKAIYNLLDDKGNSIKEVFIWYMNVKKNLYVKLIGYYNSQKLFSKNIKDLSYVSYVNLVNMVLYIYKRDSYLIFNYNLGNNILLEGLSLKYWLVNEKLFGLLNKFTDIDKIKELFESKFVDKR